MQFIDTAMCSRCLFYKLLKIQTMTAENLFHEQTSIYIYIILFVCLFDWLIVLFFCIRTSFSFHVKFTF